MRRLEIQVPDELADALAPYRTRMGEILRRGLQQLKADETMSRMRHGNRDRGTGEHRVDDQSASAEEIPPLVAQLDALRAELSGGQVFEDSAELIRRERETRITNS